MDFAGLEYMHALINPAFENLYSHSGRNKNVTPCLAIYISLPVVLISL